MYNLFFWSLSLAPIFFLINLFFYNSSLIHLIIFFECIWIIFFTSLSGLSVLIDNPTLLALSLFILFIAVVESVIFYIYFLVL